MTYYSILEKNRTVLEKVGIDVTRLSEATGLPERECVSWLHHTVLPSLMPDQGSLFRDACATLLEIRTRIPKPLKIPGTRDRYYPGSMDRYWAEVQATVIEVPNPARSYVEQVAKTFDIITRGPDAHLLAYDFTLRYLKWLKQCDTKGAYDILAYLRHVLDMEKVLLLSNSTGKIGIRVSSERILGVDADGFPIFGKTKDYVAVTRGTIEYETARQHAVDYLKYEGYDPTSNPDIFVHVRDGTRVKLYDQMLNQERDGYMLRYSECQ